MIDRSARSRWQNYAEQIEAFGPMGWARYKLGRLLARRASPGEVLTVRTRLASHPLFVRAHTSDISVFAQIFIHREYRPLDDVDVSGLIVDCGANVGYSAAYLLSRFPRADLVAIEPHPDNFRTLCDNVRPYGQRCRAIEAGVWSSPGDLVASEAPLGDRQEWAVTVRVAADDEEPTVPAVDLASVLAESGHERIALLKVDIEGAEVEVFAKNTSAWLDKVDCLAIELHGDRSREVVMSAMAPRGFDVSTSEELTIFRRPARRERTVQS
jgi:FkbM family methyltransferase